MKSATCNLHRATELERARGAVAEPVVVENRLLTGAGVKAMLQTLYRNRLSNPGINAHGIAELRAHS
jgi:hypothetical protein